MDPSCTIGFLCPNLEEFHKLREQAEKLLAPPLQKGVYPFFSFSDLCLEQILDASVNMHLRSLVDDHLLLEEPSPRRGKGRGSRRRDDTLDGLIFCDDEDFVVVECTRIRSESVEVAGSEESAGLFAEAEILMATTRGAESTRGAAAVNGSDVSSTVTATHNSGNTATTGTGVLHLGYFGHTPGLSPTPPPLNDTEPVDDHRPRS